MYRNRIKAKRLVRCIGQLQVLPGGIYQFLHFASGNGFQGGSEAAVSPKPDLYKDQGLVLSHDKVYFTAFPLKIPGDQF